LEEARGQVVIADRPSLEGPVETRLLKLETLHPGGLGLTRQLAKLCRIQECALVLDVASGRGRAACGGRPTSHPAWRRNRRCTRPRRIRARAIRRRRSSRARGTEVVRLVARSVLKLNRRHTDVAHGAADGTAVR